MANGRPGTRYGVRGHYIAKERAVLLLRAHIAELCEERRIKREVDFSGSPIKRFADEFATWTGFRGIGARAPTQRKLRARRAKGINPHYGKTPKQKKTHWPRKMPWQSRAFQSSARRD